MWIRDWDDQNCLEVQAIAGRRLNIMPASWYPFHYYFSHMAQKMITKATRKRKITFKINTDQIEKTQQKPWCTWNPVYFKLISMVTFSVISDSQKLSVSPSVANSIGCAVSAKRDTESVAFPSKFFRHFAGSAALILGCVGGQRQLLATYADGRTPVKSSIASLKK